MSQYERDEQAQAQKKDYLSTSASCRLSAFLEHMKNGVGRTHIPTGFKALDTVLDGGLYRGLYVLGAISSLGKTTILVQMADQIAQTGKDVLFFSLEMPSEEIMAKSISRHTLQNVISKSGDFQVAKTMRDINSFGRYRNYSENERLIVDKAIDAYSQYAEHIYICEDTGGMNTQQIRETIRRHISFTGDTPVVFIDYLQILGPYSDKFSDKQNTDKIVMELKRISIDFKTPVVAISSFNRANYREVAAMEAFKESGAIEYSSDVLIGLQPKGINQKDFDINKFKNNDPRDVELVILKNRNGRSGDKLQYSYYAPFNYFEEIICT